MRPLLTKGLETEEGLCRVTRPCGFKGQKRAQKCSQRKRFGPHPNSHFGPQNKESVLHCLGENAKNRRKVQKLFQGDLGSKQKGFPNSLLWATKSLV